MRCMRHDVFAVRQVMAADRCEHCERDVHRVWLVPGDVLNSCRACFVAATGQQPVHGLGHSTPAQEPVRPARRVPALFYLRVDGRRPA